MFEARKPPTPPRRKTPRPPPPPYRTYFSEEFLSRHSLIVCSFRPRILATSQVDNRGFIVDILSIMSGGIAARLHRSYLTYTLPMRMCQLLFLYHSVGESTINDHPDPVPISHDCGSRHLKPNSPQPIGDTSTLTVAVSSAPAWLRNWSVNPSMSCTVTPLATVRGVDLMTTIANPVGKAIHRNQCM